MPYTPVTFVDGTTPLNKQNLDAMQAGIIAAERTENKAVANGYPSLDANTKIPVAQLPAALPGAELAYAEFTTSVAITATTEATAVAIVLAPTVTFDGATRVCVEFFAPSVLPASAVGAAVIVVLYDGTSIGFLGQVMTPTANTLTSPVSLRRFLTPSAASHTYTIRAFQAGGNGNVQAGVGGPGVFQPGYIRITRA